MVVVNILHMNSGNGESSYANNSSLQETIIRKSVPILKDAIKGIGNHEVVFGQCFKMADLGCSSGKNTLLVVSNIIDIVYEMCKENNRKAPQFQVYLNDLFGNDFNNLFKLLPDFYANLTKEGGGNFGRCFISAVPGSFYGRLFPDESLHLVHSSTSVHWLSQVPEGLENNRLNIYMAKTSPQNVIQLIQAYAKQFYDDFTKFVRLRSEELVCGGSMVLAFPGRNTVNPTNDDSCIFWELLAQSLFSMVKEGLVRESDISSFNIPNYYPCEDEVRKLICNEGSFSLDKMNVFETNWYSQDADFTNMNDLSKHNHIHGKNTAQMLRAAVEPLLTSHFGHSIIEILFKKYEKHVADHLVNTKTRFFNIVVSLTKKMKY